ncbi:MAG: hypothetical protein KF724_07460 [Phycisphaeraceae bacterium]|nr:hypothetical protein [Phycisphaeraceae bacterium]
MTRSEKALQLFEVWAPDDSPWSDWAKPVLFTYAAEPRPPSQPSPTPPPPPSPPSPPLAGTESDSPTPDDALLQPVPLPIAEPASAPKVISLEARLLPDPASHCALVIDLPGPASFHAGVVAAQRGYRPVPLHNCTAGPAPGSFAAGFQAAQSNDPSAPPRTSSGSDLVRVDALIAALLEATAQLEKVRIDPLAPPAFLIDSARLDGKPSYGMYDNRWLLFPQDMPSGRMLRSQGIERVLVIRERGDVIHDLRSILRGWKREMLQIEKLSLADGAVTPMSIELSRFAAFGDYVMQFLIGLRTNSGGGFGGRVPDVSSSGGFS